MLIFVIRRVALGVVVLFVAASVGFVFFASQYLPLRDTPLLDAYWQWVRGLPTGHSLSHGVVYGPLLPSVVPALERTLALLGMTLVLVVALSVGIGCLAAAARGSALDLLLRAASYAAWAMPAFLVALVLQQLVAKVPGGPGLGWFPVAGWAGKCPGGLGIDLHTFRCPPAGSGLAYVGDVLYHLTLPAFALAAGFVGLHSRYLRSSLLDALDAPYVTVARGKGLPERTVVLRHALRNSLAGFTSALFSDFGAIFGASLAVDFVFQLHGVGWLFVGLLNLNSTVPVIDAYALELLLLLGGACVLVASLLGDLVVGLLDPRVGFR